MGMIRIAPDFKMALVQLTNRCNITCSHCYVSSHPHGAFGLTRERMFSLVDELAEEGICRLALSGGEPLSRSRDTLDIMRHAEGRLDILLLTNGMLITDRIVGEIVALDPVVRISLDGGDATSHDRIRGTGSFVRVMRGIELLLTAGFPPDRLEFFATLPDDAIDQIGPILDYAESIGVRRLKFEPVSKTGRAAETWPGRVTDIPDKDTERYRELFSSLKASPLRPGWQVQDIADTAFSVLTIYEAGDTYPYTWTDERDREVGYLGNINLQPLSEILDGDRLSEAVMTKFLMMARGPQRSLRALRVFQDEWGPSAEMRTRVSCGS